MKIPRSLVPIFVDFLNSQGAIHLKKNMPTEVGRWDIGCHVPEIVVITKGPMADVYCARKGSERFKGICEMWTGFLESLTNEGRTSEANGPNM